MSWVWKQGNRRFRKFFAVSSLSLAAIVAPLAILSTTPASASTPTPQLIVPADPTSTVAGVAIDPVTGAIFTVNPLAETVAVLPKVSGTLFGQQVTANVQTVLEAATGLDQPASLVFDGSGNLYISNAGYADSITVLARTTGTIFGQSVTANVATTLNAASGLTSIVSMQFDHQGDLFVVDGSTETVQVIPSADKTLFGQSVTANTVVSLTATSTIASPTILAFDPSGNLFVPDTDGKLWMVAQQSGTLFGQAVSANIPAQFAGFTFFPSQGFGGATALSFDSLGESLPACRHHSGQLYRRDLCHCQTGGVILRPADTSEYANRALKCSRTSYLARSRIKSSGRFVHPQSAGPLETDEPKPCDAGHPGDAPGSNRDAVRTPWSAWRESSWLRVRSLCQGEASPRDLAVA